MQGACPMIKVNVKGSFKRTERFLKTDRKSKILKILKEYGEKGVQALYEATPKRTGLTAESWNYEIWQDRDVYSVFWTNSNIQNGIRIAVILDLGHATGSGGYVEGRDYIHPAIQPVFDTIAGEAWKEVKNAK